MQKAAARIFFSIFFFFSNLSVRDINHCILWKQCEISLWLRKRYINCVCTWKTSSRSLMYHIRLSNNLGLVSWRNLAFQELAWRKAGIRGRELISWEKASLSSSRCPPQNTLTCKVPSFLPALLSDMVGRDEKTLPQEQEEQVTGSLQIQRFGASTTAPECALPSQRRDKIRSLWHKCIKKHLLCPQMWNTDACSASVTNFLVWVSLGAAVWPPLASSFRSLSQSSHIPSPLRAMLSNC